MEPLHLHSFFNSSTTFRVRIALELKGLPWRQTTVNLRACAQHEDNYVNVNPARLVPVLQHGRRITQSLAIIDYLDQLAPQPRLIPESGSLRTSALEAAMAIATDMHQMNNMRTQQYLSRELRVTAAQKEAWVRHWWNTGFSAVEALLPAVNDGWALGDGRTVVDCCLAPQVANALRGGYGCAGHPKLWRAYQHCMRHAAFQRAAPGDQPDYVTL